MIKIEFFPKPPPEPPAGKRSSWRVSTRRWWVLERPLGYINAKSRADAMERARAKYPDARRLHVEPKREA